MSSNKRFPLITDQALAELRQRVGKKLEKQIIWISECNEEAIRHYAHGIGDDNPLWCDPEYAKTTRYGSLLAPPSILHAMTPMNAFQGLPGIHAMYAGGDWTWHSPMRVGDKIRTETALKDLIEHKTRFSGRSIQQVVHFDLYNQRNEKVAECDQWAFRTERDTAREKGVKYKNLKAQKVYSDEEIQRIADAYANEYVRGRDTLYWEDAKVGDALPPILKGPMTITGFIAFVQGWGGIFVRAHKLAFKLFRSAPGSAIPNSRNIPDVPERVHWENEFATRVGAPAPYDYGPERISWMSHIMTNWIGDDGWLYRLNARIRRHNPEGDLLTISGKVIAKGEEAGKATVTCELRAENQDGELSCEGTAVAILPRKKSA
ncbi:MAG: acyl dehydratase [Betaproteobacteria bacterium]|nr:MAG: acyl dehydratase [Betaproteobacteria bacterium]